MGNFSMNEMDEAAWERLPHERCGELVKQINGLLPHEMFTAGETALKSVALEWFPGWRLLEATDFNCHPCLRMHFFLKPPQLIRMDGSQEPLLALCRQCPPGLDLDNVFDYAVFYMGAVQAEEGSFRLVRPGWEFEFHRDPTAEEIEKLADAIEEPEILSNAAGWLIRATVLYGDCVYRAELQVLEEGRIELKEEELLLEDMPVREIMLL